MAREKATEQRIVFGYGNQEFANFLTNKLAEGFRVVFMSGSGDTGFAILLERPKCKLKPPSKT